LDNTLCKMSQKRAHTSATKAAMGGSARFTVDIEENPKAHGVRDAGEADVVIEGGGGGNVDRKPEPAKAKAKPTTAATAPTQKAEPVDPRREEMSAKAIAGARAHGCEKLGDLFALFSKHSILATTPTSVQEIPTEAWEKLLFVWEQEREGSGATGEDVHF
jgi:hypothetical protein